MENMPRILQEDFWHTHCPESTHPLCSILYQGRNLCPAGESPVNGGSKRDTSQLSPSEQPALLSKAVSISGKGEEHQTQLSSLCTERNHLQTSVLAVMFALCSPKVLKQSKRLKKNPLSFSSQLQPSIPVHLLAVHHWLQNAVREALKHG